MGFFSRTPQKNERTLILHIGSGSVMASMVTNSDTKTAIHSFVTHDIPVVADLTLETFEKEMNKALGRTITAIAAHHMPAPDRITVYFASPWFASQVRIAKTSRPTPFIVSDTMVSDMIARELKAFENEELAGTENIRDTLRPIGSKVVQVKVDGVAHNSPLGMSARELELSIFVSVAPEHVLRMCEDTIMRRYHAPIAFSSFLLASFVVTRDTFANVHDYLLVDIGGEVTDVSLVRGGSLFQSVSFPHGSHFVLRKLSAGLHRSMTESMSLCMLYMENTLEESIKNSVGIILKDAKKVWTESFSAALSSVTGDKSIPSTILFSTGEHMASFFVDVIQHADFQNHIYNEKKIKVVELKSEIFHEFLTFDSGVERNAFIMIEALHAGKQK